MTYRSDKVEGPTPVGAARRASTSAPVCTVTGAGGSTPPITQDTPGWLALRGTRPTHPAHSRPQLAPLPTAWARRILPWPRSKFLSAWLFLKDLQARYLVVPVVGDLADRHALAAIGRDIAALGTEVSALCVSNVEQYLWRDEAFAQFAENAAALPRNARSVLIRSYFGRNFGTPHPLAGDGGMALSTQLMQTLNDFAARRSAGGWSSYWDLVTLGAIDLASTR